VNWSIIRNDNPVLVPINVQQGRDELIFNKGAECIGIHTSRIDLTCDIAIYCHSREEAEVGPILKLDQIRDNLALRFPTMRTCSTTRIYSRFIEKNNLFWNPASNLSKPSISKALILLCCLFRQLTLASNIQDRGSVTNLLMWDSKFFEDIAEPPHRDGYGIPGVYFSKIFLQ